MYIKCTKWINAYNEVFGRRPPPSTPDYTPASNLHEESTKLRIGRRMILGNLTIAVVIVPKSPS